MFINIDKKAAHDRCEVNKMVWYDDLKTKFVSIGNDSRLKVWDLQTFKLINQIQYQESYLTALLNQSKGLIVGFGSGQICNIDIRTLEIANKNQIHDGCVSDIIEVNGNYATVGHDGKFSVIDSKSMNQIQSLCFDSPLDQIVFYKQKYYIAGVRSFQISENVKSTQIGRVSFFQQHDGQLYGTNDQKGLFCYSIKFNSYVPCETMVSVEDGIIGTSWSAITYFIEDQYNRLRYKGTKSNYFRKGDSINCMLASNNNILAGGQSGLIYKLKWNGKYNWLEQ